MCTPARNVTNMHPHKQSNIFENITCYIMMPQKCVKQKPEAGLNAWQPLAQ